jgi:hypothetical protein
MLKRLSQPSCTLASIALFASALMAQSTGTIQGTVLDPTAAAVPNYHHGPQSSYR